tara:strand:- start:5099 stop:5845 length:747 start_codon:yes stop_codon:yes gene_type:complete
MPTNFYFQSGDNIGTTNEQRLVEDLIIESLKIYGHDTYYLPRTLVNKDTIFDEDELSKFTQAYPMEMYLDNVNGYEGQGDIFTRFGLEVRDQATFVMAKRRWENMVETTGGTFTQTERPSEGDLIYLAKTKSLFEIKYVDFQNPFYQLNQIYVYRLVCELFEYSSEDLDTGIATIDGIETKYSQDMLEYQMLQEDGTLMLNETNGSIITEAYSSSTSEPIDNADFDSLVTLEGILDFSEKNPFGEIGA